MPAQTNKDLLSVVLRPRYCGLTTTVLTVPGTHTIQLSVPGKQVLPLSEKKRKAIHDQAYVRATSLVAKERAKP